MKLAIIYSGGKDSNMALLLAKREGHEIKCLINIMPENKYSYMFHYPNADLTNLQAIALELPLIQIKTKGEKEKELDDLKKAIKQAIKEYKIDGIAIGGIKSNYQGSRFEKIAQELKIKVFCPLWQKDELEVIRDLKKEKFKTIFVNVAADRLNKSFLNKEITDYIGFFEKNRKILNPAGEGGEYESLVLDMPMFKKRIEIIDYDIKEISENEAEMIIKKARLVKKQIKLNIKIYKQDTINCNKY